MILKKQQTNIVKPILQTDGVNIESADHFNFLGLIVDSHEMSYTHRALHIFAEKCIRYKLIRVVNNSPFVY